MLFLTIHPAATLGLCCISTFRHENPFSYMLMLSQVSLQTFTTTNRQLLPPSSLHTIT